MLALFNLGGGEIILMLALVLILFGARKLPELAKGLGQGIFTFRDATRRVTDAVDDQASEAGRSVGGIYRKAGFQALTPDNQVAELYDPAVFKNKPQPVERRRRMIMGIIQIWRWIWSKVQGPRPKSKVTG